MTRPEIRRLAAADHAAWAALWRGYNDFYDRRVEDRVTARLWDRLTDGSGEPHGFGADVAGRLVGFAHYYFQPSSSDWAPRLYLQDLFAAPDMCGRGLGRSLIEAVYGEADRAGAAQTYWLTAADNATARKLYDRVATLTPFIKYART